MNETLIDALILIPCLIVAIVTHEVAHGLVALRLGDTTARDLNRLSLNLLVPGALALSGGPIFGWAKPVPVIRNLLRNPRRDMALVGAAGPAVNLVLALLGAIGMGLVLRLAQSMSFEPSELVFRAFFYFISINVFLAIFNLLPLPPFDGSHIVEGLLPPQLADAYGSLRRYGMLVFGLLVAVTWLAPQFDVIGRTIGVPVDWLINLLLNWAAAIGGL
jgi:Zn-dependent protease